MKLTNFWIIGVVWSNGGIRHIPVKINAVDSKGMILRLNTVNKEGFDFLPSLIPPATKAITTEPPFYVGKASS